MLYANPINARHIIIYNKRKASGGKFAQKGCYDEPRISEKTVTTYYVSGFPVHDERCGGRFANRSNGQKKKKPHTKSRPEKHINLAKINFFSVFRKKRVSIPPAGFAPTTK